MSDKQFLDYCGKVNKEVEQLKKDGWDDGTIKVFVDKLGEDVNVGNYLEQINKSVGELHKDRIIQLRTIQALLNI